MRIFAAVLNLGKFWDNAARDRIKASRKVPPRPYDDLREEERVVVYRKDRAAALKLLGVGESKRDEKLDVTELRTKRIHEAAIFPISHVCILIIRPLIRVSRVTILITRGDLPDMSLPE